MMRSMYSGVSGLKNHQIRMDSIGNNIANVNTIGFKASRVNFQDTLSQMMRGATAPSGDGTRGGINPMQIGLGMNVASIDVLHSQGNLQNTGQLTDLAIQGDGFFILSDGSQQYYTRAGNFIKDENGKIVNSSNGLMVRGWVADTTGVINTNTNVTNIQLPVGMTIQPRATTEIEFGGNLHPDITGELTFPPLTVDDGAGHVATVNFTITRIDGTFNQYNWSAIVTGGVSAPANPTGTISVDATGAQITAMTNFPFNVTPAGAGAPIAVALPGAVPCANQIVAGANTSNGVFNPVQPVVTTTRVFDSLGISHTFVTSFTKTGVNTWSWNTVDQSGMPLAGNTGTLNFSTSGQLLSVTGGPITCAPVGAQAMSVTMDFSQATQAAGNVPLDPDEINISPTAVETYDQNGYAMGELNGFNIGKTGIIVGTFTNGETRNLAQIAIANFTNPGGLIRTGDTMFQESSNSGAVRIGVGGTGGRGLMTPGAIEMSNVDLSNEFTDMIVTERGFQANSRIITTSDEMLQELVNLKR